jgi:hypothetical protein
MKAKLIKTDVNYLLTDEEDVVIASTSFKTLGISLCKQNCDKIFGVVDVEKLANENCIAWENSAVAQGGFKLGFNKAIELNKDKLFTEEQMFRMFLFGHSLSEAIKRGVIEDKAVGEIFNDRIKFIQQPTEIDVEIVMEPYRMSDFVEDGNTHPSGAIERPKLDSEGCLKLKKIED